MGSADGIVLRGSRFHGDNRCATSCSLVENACFLLQAINFPERSESRVHMRPSGRVALPVAAIALADSTIGSSG